MLKVGLLELFGLLWSIRLPCIKAAGVRFWRHHYDHAGNHSNHIYSCRP